MLRGQAQTKRQADKRSPTEGQPFLPQEFDACLLGGSSHLAVEGGQVVQNLRPSSIKLLIVTPRESLIRGRLWIESKISLSVRPRSAGIGTSRACSFPRRVITISSPRAARSTS